MNRTSIISSTVDEYLNLAKDTTGRYASFDYCRQCFIDNRIEARVDENKKDLITLNLFAYLGSWGMFRNSSLMQKNYKALGSVVDTLCSEKFNMFLENDQYSYNDCIDDIYDLTEIVSESYTKIYGAKPSDTLITKILLGTFGCIPAYDRFFQKGVRLNGICGNLGKRSLKELVKFINDNRTEIEAIRGTLENKELYTPMKVVDMYFFEIGRRNLGKDGKNPEE